MDGERWNGLLNEYDDNGFIISQGKIVDGEIYEKKEGFMNCNNFVFEGNNM